MWLVLDLVRVRGVDATILHMRNAVAYGAPDSRRKTYHNQLRTSVDTTYITYPHSIFQCTRKGNKRMSRAYKIECVQWVIDGNANMVREKKRNTTKFRFPD